MMLTLHCPAVPHGQPQAPHGAHARCNERLIGDEREKEHEHIYKRNKLLELHNANWFPRQKAVWQNVVVFKAG